MASVTVTIAFPAAVTEYKRLSLPLLPCRLCFVSHCLLPVTMGKTLGLIRAVYMVSICCVGSFLFAYDTGIIGGILTLESFQNSFRYGEAQKSTINSNSNSLLQAGGNGLTEP